MHSRTAVCLLLVPIGLWPAAAAAQPSEGTNELTVFGGVSLLDASTDEDDSFPLDRPTLVSPSIVRFQQSLGDSAELGVRYGRYLTERAAIEGDFSVAPSHDLRRHFSFDCPPGRVCIADRITPRLAPNRLDERRVVAYHYGAGVAFDLLDGAIRPIAIGGLGGVTYDAEGLGRTDLVLRVGGGLKGYIGRLHTRFDVVDHIVSDHFLTGRAEHDVHVRAGFGVGW